MYEQYWELAVQQATHLKSRLLSSSLGDRSPYEMVFQHKPDLSRVNIFGSRVHAWLPPQIREGTLADRTRTGGYVGHLDSNSLCIVLDENIQSPVSHEQNSGARGP